MVQKPTTKNINDYFGDPLAWLRDNKAYYECPRDEHGNRTGKLVGYAGRYLDEQGIQKQYCGDIYVNCSPVEEYPSVLNAFAEWLSMPPELAIDCMVGMPMGGLMFGQALAQRFGTRYIFAEKKVTQAETATQREVSHLFFGRHEPRGGESVVLVEDVVNNGTTVAQAVRLVEGYGAQVVGIACILNRSTTIGDAFESDEFPRRAFPIKALIHKPFAQFRQDDPFVADDIAAGKFVPKPKNNWFELIEAR